jgi:Zn finger protein HypA/HybF involved in hydrogenase expression
MILTARRYHYECFDCGKRYRSNRQMFKCPNCNEINSFYEVS